MGDTAGKKVLLTSRSYQETPGKHHDLLKSANFDLHCEKGPLSEERLLELLSETRFEGFLHGDDDITAKVIDFARPDLKVLAKYGIGIDCVDVEHATKVKLPVLFTPGVNHTTVAEHTFFLMGMLVKNLYAHVSATKNNQWTRETGTELANKTVGIIGFGRIGQEVAKRAKAFEMNTLAYRRNFDQASMEVCKNYDVKVSNLDEIFAESDFVCLHTPATPETNGMVTKERIAQMKDGSFIVNAGRGSLVVEDAIIEACQSGKLAGYGTDVLDKEPMRDNHPFCNVDNIIVTPHIGSRTFESVERQALRATNNIINFLSGNSDYIQANQF